MRKRVLLGIVCACALMLPSCRHYSANMSNPQVAMAVTLLDASNVCRTMNDGLLTANSVVERLEATEPDYYNHVKPLLRKLSTANKSAQHKIDTVASGGVADWKGAIVALGSSVTPADLTTWGFKNPTSQIIVESGFAAVVLTLQQIPQKFGGAN